MICVLVMTDGRDDVLARTIESAEERLRGPITRRVLHTDNGPEHVGALSARYRPPWEVIGGERAGFGGAIDRAWRYVARGDERAVFHLEDDFLFNRPVDVNAMWSVLDAHKHLAQLALRRQPWNADEERAGGIVEQWPDEYTEREWIGHRWLEHRLFWTTNPSLFRIDRCRDGWPDVRRSEAHYTQQVLADVNARFGYWGARDSGEWVAHIGVERVGSGY